MNITSAKYCQDTLKDTGNISITAVIDEETMYVPINPDNRHYAEIMRQVDEGSLTVAEAD